MNLEILALSLEGALLLIAILHMTRLFVMDAKGMIKSSKIRKATKIANKKPTKKTVLRGFNLQTLIGIKNIVKDGEVYEAQGFVFNSKDLKNIKKEIVNKV